VAAWKPYPPIRSAARGMDLPNLRQQLGLLNVAFARSDPIGPGVPSAAGDPEHAAHHRDRVGDLLRLDQRVGRSRSLGVARPRLFLRSRAPARACEPGAGAWSAPRVPGSSGLLRGRDLRRFRLASSNGEANSPSDRGRVRPWPDCRSRGPGGQRPPSIQGYRCVGLFSAQRTSSRNPRDLGCPSWPGKVSRRVP